MPEKLEGFELDCAIIRSAKSAEMHNLFVCMRLSGKSSKEIFDRYDEIRNDVDCLEKINKFNKELEEKQLLRKKELEYINRNGA